MSTLHHEKLLFNDQINISNDGGELANDAGTLLIAEFLHQIHFDQLLEDNLHFKDDRKYCTFPLNNLFKQLLLQLLAGYCQDQSANTLSHAVDFKLVLSQAVASQPTLSRFINHISASGLFSVKSLLGSVAHFVLGQLNQHQLILDLDSTHADTFGDQEKSAYNGHYQTNGYHPLLAFDALSGCLLNAQLRPGNRYTSQGATKFLLRSLRAYDGSSLDVLVRGDSGFAAPGIYHACDKKQAKFVIRLKANYQLQSRAENLIQVGDQDFTEAEVQWHVLRDYCPQSWSRPYRVIIKSTRPAGNFLFDHEFIVTNLEELSGPQVFALYHQRGSMEDLIKEVKRGFHFDKTDSSSFEANEFRMLVAGVAYNILQAMKNLVLPTKLKHAQVGTIRFKLLHVAAKVTHHARQVWVHLSQTNVFAKLFWQTLFKIQNLKIYPL
ncbi:IS1380 family transposase [Ligilactobacillus acidipiscis]|uniref:Transposase DDE domain-containing protein n=1 Tax=Ligilactobacillus acidipiscis TaxID=89059 RepID=A0A1K1KR90_9LACO|nr:IS1380 family transposase [Ligilactobacillus acidipiscis]SFV41388.1 hypothetical protein LAC1533_1965 [Ligilactobacillus acidipiscis]